MTLRSSPSSQQQEEPLLLLSRLPEALQLQVLSLSTVKDCLSVALSNRTIYHEIWENSRLWHSFLIGFDAQRQDLGNLSTLQLQDKFRWEHFGIALLAAGKELVAESNCAILQKAERAVRAMLPRDATVAEPVTKALSAMIGNAHDQSGRAVPEECTQALVSVVTSQHEVFSMEQTLDLVSVHQHLHAQSHLRSQPSQRVRHKKRLSRNQSGDRDLQDSPSLQKQTPPLSPATFNDEVYGRLSGLFSDLVSEIASAPAAPAA